jgi:hypothetical protein
MKSFNFESALKKLQEDHQKLMTRKMSPLKGTTEFSRVTNILSLRRLTFPFIGVSILIKRPTHCFWSVLV